MSDTAEIQDDQIKEYMTAPVPEEVLDRKRRRAHVLSRHQTVRDLYMYRKLQMEEYNTYPDKDYRNQQLTRLQKEFRDNLIERLTVVQTLREMGEPVTDPLIADKRESAADKVEEAEVLAYMHFDAPVSELATEEDRVAYYRKRLNEVEDTYRYLKLQQEEVEQYKDKSYREATMNKLKLLYRQNYTERVAVVTALRKCGAKVEDRFVPLSKV